MWEYHSAAPLVNLTAALRAVSTAECLAGHWDAHWAVQMDAQMADLWESKMEKNSADHSVVQLENSMAKRKAGSTASHWE